jgi:chaperone modulatory protein CbpM
MIMRTREFVLQARIDAEELGKWVAAGWLLPRQNSAGQDYSDVDLARAHLIRDLQQLGVNDESIPVVLDLIDQLHGLRRMLREVLSAMKVQHQERDRT